MRLLWLCNSLIPEVAKELGVIATKSESWIKGVYEDLCKEEKISLLYLFPNKSDKLFYRVNNTTFLSYSENNAIRNLEEVQKEYFVRVIDEFKPDVVHIFGTEYLHSYTMIQACKKLNIVHRAVISIQGLVSIYAKHYYAYLPNEICHKYSIRDIVRRDNIYRQKKKFEMRGEVETKALLDAQNIIGRTDWDKACVQRINSNVNYFFCNETLRNSFYKHKWNFDKCEEYSIFVSQSNYPIKGFHLMLEAMQDIIKFFPKTHLYVTGESPFVTSKKKKILQTEYKKYLGKLIDKLNLKEYVTFLGTLGEEEMCQRFIKSHVFVSCSSIENSPNSVGEAMLLGVPIVCSDVGGVKNLLVHDKEGYIYPADEPYMLAYYVKQIFSDRTIAEQFSQAAIDHARITHNRDQNYIQLKKIYEQLEKDEKNDYE